MTAAVPGSPPAPARPGLQVRLSAWLGSRVPPADTLELTHRNVYILPTAAGWVFAATLVVLLLASINYQLNLGYALTFLLAGSGFTSMHVTHRTLRGLTLHLRPPSATHAGDPAPIELVLTNPGEERHGIGLRIAAAGEASADTVHVDVPAGAQCTAVLRHHPPERGRQRLPTVSVETRFPLGLFRAWAVWRPASPVLVWPRAEHPAAPLPGALATLGAPAGARRAAQGTETEGVRPYRRGDAVNRVAWRKAARLLDGSGELVVRDLGQAARWQLWIDWAACHPLPPEHRLQRMTAWVLEAQSRGADYGLALPGLRIEPGAGAAQRERCLEALACWRGPGPNAGGAA